MDPDKNDVLAINIAIFSFIAIFHLVRYILHVPIEISGYNLPTWFSGIFFLVAIGMVAVNWSISDKSKITFAKVIAILISIDLIGVLAFWYYRIDFLGITPDQYYIIALIDIAIIGYLIWYIRRN